MRRRIYIVVLRIFLITVVLALIIDQLFVKVIIPGQYEFSNVKKISRLIDGDKENEVPIFGSSIAKHTYYPDSIGPGFYNYGMAGSVYVMLEPLLKIEMEKDKDSPVIIDFEHHFFLSHKEIRIQLSNYIPYIDNSHIRNMLTERELMKYQYDVPGLRLFGMYDEYLLDLLRLRFKRGAANGGGLFFNPKPKDFELFRVRRQRMIDEMKELRDLSRLHPELMTKDKSYKLELLDILLNSRPDQSYVDRFEELLRENSERKFILVYSPQHEIKLMGLENHDEVVRLLERLDEAHPNLEVLDYSTIGFSDELFHDAGHMNVLGAYKFSNMLRDDLKTLIPEHYSRSAP